MKETNCFGNECNWITEGTGPIGGAEAGHVIYKYDGSLGKGFVTKVKFWWYNPRNGANTCGGIVIETTTGTHGRVGAGCDITHGNSATATYWVNYRPLE